MSLGFVAAGTITWGTPLELEISVSRAPAKPPRGETLRSPRPNVTSVLARLVGRALFVLTLRVARARCGHRQKIARQRSTPQKPWWILVASPNGRPAALPNGFACVQFSGGVKQKCHSSPTYADLAFPAAFSNGCYCSRLRALACNVLRRAAGGGGRPGCGER